MADNGPLILVVDDQIGVRLLIQEIFAEVGYRVATAANGREAIDQATAAEPALVLLDMRMPVMEGVETLRQLRRIYPHLPVYMMTAVGDECRQQEVLEAGARGCIYKPFDIFVLRKLVEDTLREERKA